MKKETEELVRLFLAKDETMTDEDRERVIRAGRAPKDDPRGEYAVMTFSEAARTFRRTTKTIQNMCRRGTLRKVRLPGYTRSCGVWEPDFRLSNDTATTNA